MLSFTWLLHPEHHERKLLGHTSEGALIISPLWTGRNLGYSSCIFHKCISGKLRVSDLCLESWTYTIQDVKIWGENYTLIAWSAFLGCNF